MDGIWDGVIKPYMQIKLLVVPVALSQAAIKALIFLFVSPHHNVR
jgi:hypothetical protein